MKVPVNVQELKVVGYANVLSRNMLPWIVAPVFEWKTNSDRYLLPPFYVDDAGYVKNGTEVGGEELQSLSEAEEITLFPPNSQVWSGQQGFDLWVDQDLKPHYEPAGLVRAQLSKIAADHVVLAEDALKNRQFAQAEELAGVAICADDRRIEPLVIRAVVCRIENNLAGERLMAKMASSALETSNFNALVERYQASMAQPVPVHPAVYGARKSATSGMAAVK